MLAFYWTQDGEDPKIIVLTQGDGQSGYLFRWLSVIKTVING